MLSTGQHPSAIKQGYRFDPPIPTLYKLEQNETNRKLKGFFGGGGGRNKGTNK